MNNIQQQIAAIYGDTGQVSDMENLTDGWETDIYAFRLTRDGETESLVLRLFSSEDGAAKSQREFAALKILHQLGYPVPHAQRLTTATNSPFGRPFFIMNRIEAGQLGESIRNLGHARDRTLLRRFCQLLADLHALDWRPHHPTIDNGPYAFIDGRLDEFTTFINQFNLSDAMPVMNWLRDRRDSLACDHLSILHGDFHPWNVLLGPDDALTVIDWSGYEIGDPRYDLAWTLVLVGSYRGDDAAAATLHDYQQTIGRDEITGMDAFRVMAALRRVGSMWISMKVGAERMGMRPGAEDTMREHLPAMRYAYEMVVNITGLHMPELASLLK